MAMTGDFIQTGFEDPCFLMSRAARFEGEGKLTGERLLFFLKDGNLSCVVFMVISFGKTYRAMRRLYLHHE
jgi:hypothetical protein